jgi:hypothetical protein
MSRKYFSPFRTRDCKIRQGVLSEIQGTLQVGESDALYVLRERDLTRRDQIVTWCGRPTTSRVPMRQLYESSIGDSFFYGCSDKNGYPAKMVIRILPVVHLSL